MDNFDTPVLLKGPVSRILRRRSEFQGSPKSSFNCSPSLNVSHSGDLSLSVLGGRGDGEMDVSHRESFLNGTPHSATLLQDNPDSLFVEFLGTCAEFSSGFKTLDQVAEFEQLVGDHLEALKQITAKQGGLRNTNLENFKDERNTWRLLGKLYHDRLRTLNKEDQDMESETNSLVNPWSEKLIVDKLFQRNHELREAQVIVYWLEANMADSGAHISAERFSDATVSWENSLHTLGHSNNANKRHMVSQMDPDAPRRQNKPLHDLDMQDQNMLCDAIFTYIKSGMLENAQNLCVKLGQPWRAATLEGWKLFHDENYARTETTKKLPCEGNKTRDIWKRSAWKMTRDEKMPVYERAAYSAFCGNVKQLLSVCKTWDDCLWALTRCYIDLIVETEIRAVMRDRTFVELPQEYWDENKSSMREVLECMETLDNDSVKSARSNSYKVIQCCLISQDYVGLLQRMLEWIKEPQDPHLLRLFCHLIIVFRRLNASQGDDSIKEMEDAVLQVYVIYLMGADKAQLIAWYTAQLPVSVQINLYSKFLENVTTYGDRKLCLDLALESDLPIEDITTQVVINIRTQEEAQEEATFQPVMTERDKRKIDALSWLIFFDSQRDEAVFQCNALVRSFIAAGKIQSAQEALQKIPEDSINLINRQHRDDAPKRVSNALREYLGLSSYLQAQEAFSDWFDHFSKGQPRRPELKQNASFVEKVAFEQREEQYQVEMERWCSAQLIQSRAASERLTYVLTFPEGWLVDGLEEEEHGDQRLEELEYLRKLIIPKLTFLLHTVLHGTKQFREAIRLADLIASDRYELYRLFTNDKLREILNKIHESSVAAMDTGSQDPWGFLKK